MKPAPFAYAKARSVEDAVKLLGEHEDAKLLAGGQSLMATLNMRLSAPTMLIDLNGISGLDTIAVNDGVVEIGALARHSAVMASDIIAKHAPLIAMAMPHIGHPAIRNRGTFGGSVAFADPAAELPACFLALGGEAEITGPGGNWESSRFHLPSQVHEAIPKIGDDDTAIVLHNDAVVQGLSEVPFMQDIDHWAVLTIGTGLGNARFTNRHSE